MFNTQRFVGGISDNDDSIDDDVPRSHRRLSFVGARNSQELIPTHLEKTFERRLRQAVATFFFGPFHVRFAFSTLVALVLCAVCCQQKAPEKVEEWLELGVICLTYGFWLVFCAPMLLVTINIRLFWQVVNVFFKVYFADLAVMTFAYYRGHNNVLRRGFNLFPILEANRPGRGLAWLGQAGYNLRLASLLACFLIGLIVTAIEIWTTGSFDLM